MLARDLVNTSSNVLFADEFAKRGAYLTSTLLTSRYRVVDYQT